MTTLNEDNPLDVVILAAGQGTRMKSDLAKVLHEVLERPMIEWVLRAIEPLNPRKIIVVVGHQRDSVRARCLDVAAKLELGSRIEFALQEEQLGTGHALQCALKGAQPINNTLVLCGDTPCIHEDSLNRLVQAHFSTEATASLFTTEVDHPFGYGRIVRQEGNVYQIVEEKDADDEQRKIQEVNPGVYIFSSGILETRLSALENKNQQGEFYITDLIFDAATNGKVHSSSLSCEEMLGVNSQVQRSEAEDILRKRIITQWMHEGVAISMPNSVWIGPGVAFEGNAEVAPFTHLSGECHIGQNARIGAHSSLRDTTVAEGAIVEAMTWTEHACIGKGARVGPYARLREGSHLEEGSKVGNFVEMKKTTLGVGSKASHLSYLGDTTIGRNANIGAGTITCNYDGFNKHKTSIADGVFIGSNSTLVAPITIDADAFVAAGSTVVKDIPRDALAFGRASQSTKKGYAARLRKRLRKG